MIARSQTNQRRKDRPCLETKYLLTNKLGNLIEKQSRNNFTWMPESGMEMKN